MRKIRGASALPSAPSPPAAGAARSSPSESGPSTASTVTSGSAPGAAMRRCRPRSIAPSCSSSFSIAFKGMRSAPLIPKARAISRLPTGISEPRMNSRTCWRVGSPALWLRPLLMGRLRLGCLELDLDEDEFKGVGVDHVMLHAQRAVIGAPSGELGEVLLLAILELEAARRHRDHHIVIGMPMPAGRSPRRETPFGDLH